METENEIQKKALALFAEYTKILKGEFRDHEIFWLAKERNKVIAARLKTLGFEIRTEQRSYRKRTTLLRGELEIEEIHHMLKLVPHSTPDGPHLCISHPTSKICIGTLPLPPEKPLTEEITEEDARWLQEIKYESWLKRGTKAENPKIWHFTPDQRHTLLTALDRYWNLLEITAGETGKIINPRPTWKRIFEQAIEVEPSPDGNDQYAVCFLIECELKYLKAVGEILKKHSGRIVDTLCPHMQDPCTVQQFIEHMELAHLRALEEWLDNNLATKQ